jgi:hypothetical protein
MSVKLRLSELLRPQGYVASYPTDCVIVDFLRPLLLPSRFRDNACCFIFKLRSCLFIHLGLAYLLPSELMQKSVNHISNPIALPSVDCLGGSLSSSNRTEA